MSQRLRYRPDIDGLRAVAVLAVVGFHAGLSCPGGFVGVDVFFVISGFLITSQIRDDLRAGQFSVPAFWERRVRRILPAATLVTALALLVGWFLLLPIDFRELGQSVVAQSALSANVYFWREAGYFAAPSEVKPLLHMWSLAVEEQFYLLVAPLALVLVRAPRPVRRAVIPVALVLSFGWSVVGVAHHPDAAFFLLPSRAWELLLGAQLACLGARGRPLGAWAELLSGGGLLLVLIAVFGYSSTTPFPGLAALLPCVGTAAIIWANAMTMTRVGRLLACRPLVFVGLISYSLYLWHWPALAYAKYLMGDGLSTSVSVSIVVVSFVFASASWRWVEAPFRRRRVCATRQSAFVWSAMVTALLLAAGIGLHARGGVPTRFSTEALQYADGARDRYAGRGALLYVSLDEIGREGWPRIGRRADTRPPRLMVVGDSHAVSLLPAVDQLCEAYDTPTIVAARLATLPLPGVYMETRFDEKRAFHDRVLATLRDTPSLEHVLLVARWMGYSDLLAQPERWSPFLDTLRRRGVRIWVVHQVPVFDFDVPRALALAEHFQGGAVELRLDRSDVLARRADVDAAFRVLEEAGATFIDPLAILCPDEEPCRIEDARRSLYFDDDHLSATGARLLIPLLRPVFEEIAIEP